MADISGARYRSARCARRWSLVHQCPPSRRAHDPIRARLARTARTRRRCLSLLFKNDRCSRDAVVKLDRLFGVAACVIVALGLVLAFRVIGPPSHARLIALDQQRVSDIESIASRVHDRFGQTTGGLPRRLPSDLQARDPVTRRGYTFQRIDAKSYMLCARFALAAESENVEQWPSPQNWPHDAGLTCYKFNVSAPGVVPTIIRQ